jgi:hypothetical protein
LSAPPAGPRGISGGAEIHLNDGRFIRMKSAGPSRLKKAAVNGGLLALTLCLVWVAAEVTLRVAFGDKYGKRPGFFVADPVLGWKPRPKLDHTFYGADFSIRVATDENGYRLGTLGKVDFRKRLVLLSGDSNVFGWGVSTEESMASYLDSLVVDQSGGGKRVVNLGCGGYGTFQSYLRIKNFIARHPESPLSAVIVVHAPNDAVDNVNSIGYHIGSWEVRDRTPKSRSVFHTVNLIAYSIEIVRGLINPPDKRDTVDPEIHEYLQDMLFAFDTKLPKKLPSEIDLNGRRISFEGVSDQDYLATKTFARGDLTRLQRELLEEAVRSIHALFKDGRVKVIHVMVPTSPDWFTVAVDDAVEKTMEGARVEFAGTIFDIEDYGEQVLNDHAGGHYTPAFNRFWALKILETLEGRGSSLER